MSDFDDLLDEGPPAPTPDVAPKSTPSSSQVSTARNVSSFKLAEDPNFSTSRFRDHLEEAVGDEASVSSDRIHFSAQALKFCLLQGFTPEASLAIVSGMMKDKYGVSSCGGLQEVLLG